MIIISSPLTAFLKEERFVSKVASCYKKIGFYTSGFT